MSPSKERESMPSTLEISTPRLVLGSNWESARTGLDLGDLSYYS